jgi:aryl-alcohol dehydrogenase-like predicted oxidoreductase
MVFTKRSRVWDAGGTVRSELSRESLRRECEAASRVWSPLMRGLLAGHLTHAIATLPPNDTRRDEPELREPRLSRNLALVQRLRRVARRQGRTPAQVAIAAAATMELDDDDLDELAA